jgi:hypothetical protein
MPPPAIDRIDQSWAGESKGSVTRTVDPVLDYDCQMLIPTKMDGSATAKLFQGSIALRLWPSIAI